MSNIKVYTLFTTENPFYSSTPSFNSEWLKEYSKEDKKQISFVLDQVFQGCVLLQRICRLTKQKPDNLTNCDYIVAKLYVEFEEFYKMDLENNHQQIISEGNYYKSVFDAVAKSWLLSQAISTLGYNGELYTRYPNGLQDVTENKTTTPV